MRFIIVKSCLFLCVLFLNAQNNVPNTNILNGKIIVTKDGVSLNKSIELTKGTSIDFQYDGTSLDVSIGQKLYKNIEISSGFAIKLEGDLCYYMTISDGIELGAFST